MFVFQSKDLPADPVFPADLEKLGYFINAEDQIKMISNPEQDFQFKISTSDRWNEMQKEAMNTCIRDIVLSRLYALGLSMLRLPIGAAPDEPNVPILVSSNLSTATRVLVIFGEPGQDLGIWAYRKIGQQTIGTGSAVSLAKAVLAEDSAENPRDTALIIANTGQLIWHCGTATAMTMPTWLALPRKSAVNPPLQMTYRNHIPQNQNWQEHVECVFEQVLAARGRFLREDAKIDIIGLAEGGAGAVSYLARNWKKWHNHIAALCLSNPLDYLMPSPMDFDTEESVSDGSSTFRAFLSSRCRAYILSDQPVDSPMSSDQDQLCNYYSSGESLYAECIMPSAWKNMLAWLDRLHDDPYYEEVELLIQ